MNITQYAKNILDSYYVLLNTNIDKYGYCPEILDIEQAQQLNDTRLLCQTRGIYYLLDYATISNSPHIVNTALNIYDVINEKYLNKIQVNWVQYPNKTTTTIDVELYGYAFLLTALAKLYSYCNDQEFKDTMYRISEIISQQFYMPNTKFAKLHNLTTGVSQNALMHLFEAYMEATIATKEQFFTNKLITLGNELLNFFYDIKIGLIKEFSNVNLFEAGHSFEWASLIYEAKNLGVNFSTQIDHTILVATAEKLGIFNNMVLSEIHDDTANYNTKYRIWPNLERLRYYAMINDQSKINSMYVPFIDKFFINGLPIEYIDNNFKPAQTTVKSTTGYHLINCFKYFK